SLSVSVMIGSFRDCLSRYGFRRRKGSPAFQEVVRDSFENPASLARPHFVEMDGQTSLFQPFIEKNQIIMGRPIVDDHVHSTLLCWFTDRPFLDGKSNPRAWLASGG